MKLTRRIWALLLCALLLPAAAGRAASAGTVLRKGNYVTLGSYMGEPIVWRCVGEDENGILLISRDILCFKAYGSASGRWDKSFLREWLNSADASVAWSGPAPDASVTDGNAYAAEAGFLTGFSPEEAALIKTVEQKSVINGLDAADAAVGESVHVYSSNGLLADTVQNYADAFGVMTEDKVFCPNIEQMEIMASFYPSEVIAEPRASAVEQSGNAKNAENRSNNYYWLRDGLGNTEFPAVARCIFPNGRALFSDVDDGSVGVRPAIYLDSRQTAVSGKGYEASPYVLAPSGRSYAPAKGSPARALARESAQGAFSSVTEGDYLYMGTAYGEDILWRCVDITPNGPLMLSDKILFFRAFDASGGEHNDPRRNSLGGNCWETSTLRAWLNSNEGEGDKSWPSNNPPSSERTGGSNGYSRQSGFLTFFSPEELNCVKPSWVRSTINVLDIDENTVGSRAESMRRNIAVAANSPEAYAGDSWDTFFLLSISEARNLKNAFGTDILAVPTPEALNLNEVSSDEKSADMTASWWLRDADGQAADPFGVRVITQDGWVDRDDASSPGVGVRPAFYLNIDAAAFVSGSGGYDDPYRLGGHSYGEWFVAKEPGCAEQGVRRRICAVCGGADEEPILAVGHSFGKAKTRPDGLFTVSERTCERCGAVHAERRLGLPAVAVGTVLLLAAALWAAHRVIKK